MHGGAVLGLLDFLEPGVDASPTRRDEIDEEREVVDAGMALREQVALEPLEAADRLVQQASDLGDVPRDRKHFDAQTVADSGADLLGQRSLELSGRLRERLDLVARAYERRLQLCRRNPPGGRVNDPCLRPLESLFVHGQEATLLVGWTRPSSTTSFRRS